MGEYNTGDYRFWIKDPPQESYYYTDKPEYIDPFVCEYCKQRVTDGVVRNKMVFCNTDHAVKYVLGKEVS
jgi:hypothetical protein